MFRDMKQQLQFAFNFTQHSAHGTDAAELATLAKRTLLHLRADLLDLERASLVAAFTRDELERRAAVTVLSPLFRELLRHLECAPELVDKLLRRHYIPVRERGPAWELPAIADQFKAARDRVARASQEIDKRARALEQAALEALAAAMQREVSHA